MQVLCPFCKEPDKLVPETGGMFHQSAQERNIALLKSQTGGNRHHDIHQSFGIASDNPYGNRVLVPIGLFHKMADLGHGTLVIRIDIGDDLLRSIQAEFPGNQFPDSCGFPVSVKQP